MNWTTNLPELPPPTLDQALEMVMRRIYLAKEKKFRKWLAQQFPAAAAKQEEAEKSMGLRLIREPDRFPSKFKMRQS